jgi:hypothetical protein
MTAPIYQNTVKGIRERVLEAANDLTKVEPTKDTTAALNSLIDALAHLRVEENKEGK